MSAKLHINIHEGMISVEGDEKFVEGIYTDFRDRLLSEVSRYRTISDQAPPAQIPRPGAADKRNENPPVKKRAAGSTNYNPKVNPDLDLAKLPEFYSGFKTKNNSERILLFSVFLREQLNKAPCSADDIFSCYFALKSQLEIPENMYQAFANAWARTKWVQYISKDEIRITTAGENHFTEMNKKSEVNDRR